MKATELRIGSQIFWDIPEKENTIHTVVGIRNDKLQTIPISLGDSIDEYKPIPLTAEWLEKLSGEKDEFGDVFIEVDSDSDMRLYLSLEGHIQLVQSYHCPMFNYEHIRHVHQLQNLYFALTGEELTIREDAK